MAVMKVGWGHRRARSVVDGIVRLRLEQEARKALRAGCEDFVRRGNSLRAAERIKLSRPRKIRPKRGTGRSCAGGCLLQRSEKRVAIANPSAPPSCTAQARLAHRA
jgi:hypothetical protein